MDLQRLVDLDVETAPFVKSMATALAIMNWHSRLSARDVEFVLGGQPVKTHYTKPTAAELSKARSLCHPHYQLEKRHRQ